MHGISDDHVKDAPGFAAVMSEVLGALEGKIPVAYNAEFDRNFLHEELSRARCVVAEAEVALAMRSLTT